MKTNGIVRKVDSLGRIVIPAETPELFGIDEGTPLAIFVSGEQIILQPYAPGCHFCGSMDQLTQYRDKHVCHRCVDHLCLITRMNKGVAINSTS